MRKHKHTLRKRCTATLGRLARCAAALLLVFSMLLAVLPVLAQGESVLADSDIPEALSRAQLEEHGAVQRLYDEEQGDNDFVFLNRDGTITRYDFSVPVKYKDETGKYRDKNNKIKDWNGEYGNTAGDVELRFPKQLNFIKIKYNGHTVRIKPVTSASPGHLPAMVQGSSVSYAGAFGEGTELRYTSTMSGIKEDIILQNSAQGNSFSFEVRTGGLELRQQDGVWGIYDGETAVFSFGDLEVTDSFTGQDEATDDWDAHRTYAQAQVSALSGDKYLFTITVPQEYLQAESTVYPVYVDPTFNVSRSYIQDTYIAKGYTNNYVNSSLVAVGYGTNAKNVRTLAKISDLFGGQTTHGRVTAAYYSMYCTSDYSSTPTVDAYMINSSVSWNPSAVTWQNSADMLMNAADKISTLTVKGAGRYNFDITSAYQAWQTGTANNGIMLRMTTEVSGKYRQFASANVSDSSKLAYVTVTYQDVALGITISPEEAYMTVGEVKRITALAHSVNETITWSSDNPSVATVDTNGNVTAHSAGDVTITATGTYGGSSATCGITVVAKGVESVTLPYRTLYLAKGKSLNVPVRIAPSDASVQQVTWSSSNTSVVTVNNGLLRAVAPGTAIISVRSEQGSKTDSMTVVVPEFEDGTYYLKNKATKKYADIQGPSNDSGAIIHQWKMHGYASQQWNFELHTDGYYKIKSMHSGLYLSVENNSSAQDAAIVQKAFNNGSGQLWKVELLNDGAYKLTPKSGESSNRVLASASYDSVDNGIVIQQRQFLNDTDYNDEWVIYDGIATSGYEVAYEPEKWNDRTGNIKEDVDSICRNTNCYYYAINNHLEPKSMQLWTIRFGGGLPQPGAYCGIDIYSLKDPQNGYDTVYPGTSKNLIQYVTEQDYAAYNQAHGGGYIFRPIGRNERCPAGSYKVALIVGSDYHWYRQNPDGFWSHKPGNMNVRNVDEQGNSIIDPQYAEWSEDYTKFIGYFAVTPWNNMYGAAVNGILDAA